MAILWAPYDGRYPIRHSDPGEVFPSWSWTSVKDAIVMDSKTTRRRWEKARSSLAIWAIPSTVNGQTSLQILATRLAVVLAWKYGCFSGSLPDTLGIDATWEHYARTVSDTWRSLAQLCDEAHGMRRGRMSAHDIETKFPSHMQRAYPIGSILIYTQSLQLRLMLREGSKELQTEAGKVVAKLVTNSVNWEQTYRKRNENACAVFDVLALSVLPEVYGDAYKNEELLWYDFEGDVLDDGFFPRVIEVELMVVETENGIGRRVYLKTWIEARPQCHTYILA
ncbi:hypothetical protein BO78DRAFT_461534 [Aspergillus sclerotiicarbonarius CBS 121057]|uniref:Uncharacterized protein n=1 Tax=Aspergillus sclerotiicarbonarius (strain CBS 121057 / IBT 28362) TaxID=1448318 RepID=A0A319EHF5_ASPSB|nr:hypothetical protein BO78DRAFT_461534 [Aspergillus sclerotiicarbonarius CBS 121057]